MGHLYVKFTNNSREDSILFQIFCKLFLWPRFIRINTNGKKSKFYHMKMELLKISLWSSSISEWPNMIIVLNCKILCMIKQVYFEYSQLPIAWESEVSHVPFIGCNACYIGIDLKAMWSDLMTPLCAEKPREKDLVNIYCMTNRKGSKLWDLTQSPLCASCVKLENWLMNEVCGHSLLMGNGWNWSMGIWAMFVKMVRGSM